MLRTREVPSIFYKETIKAFGYWFLPMFGWITCMILVAMSNETLGILIFFLLFLHPAITLPFGILDRTIRRLLKRQFRDFRAGSTWRRILVRYLTLSPLNYFTLIALGQLIMYLTWEQKSSSSCLQPRFHFKTDSFNLCEKSTIENHDKVQTILSDLLNGHIEHVLIALFVFPLVFHLIESLCINWFPDPIPILDFVIAKDQYPTSLYDTEVQVFSSEVLENPSPPRNSPFHWYEIACCLLAIIYLILIFIIPQFIIDHVTIPSKQPTCLSGPEYDL